MPIFISEKKIVYFTHIPKTGGSTIETALSKKCAMYFFNPGRKVGDFEMSCSPQHLHYPVSSKIFSSEFVNNGFLVCRDPIDRFKSEYRHKRNQWERRRVNYKPNIDDFVRETLAKYNVNPYCYDNHIRPQNEFYHKDMKLFYFENGFENILKSACELLEVEFDFEIPHEKKWEIEVDTHLSDFSVNALKDFYKNDYRIFKY